MTNELSPSEVVELAELIAGHSTDEDGNPMPLDVALQIIEDTEVYDISLTGRAYLMHLRFFYAYLNYGDLVPASDMKQRASEAIRGFCRDMGEKGFTFESTRKRQRDLILTSVYFLFLGLTIGIIIARHFKI